MKPEEIAAGIMLMTESANFPQVCNYAVVKRKDLVDLSSNLKDPILKDSIDLLIHCGKEMERLENMAKSLRDKTN